jgi:hypothetical protein
MEEGEVVVFFFKKKTDAILETLRRFGAVPARTIEPADVLQPA